MSFLNLRLTSLLVLLSLVAVPLTAQEANWPRLLNSTFDGVAETDSSKIQWSAKPQFRWALSVGSGYGLGSVDGSHYYHFDAERGRQRIRCIDLRSGKSVWSEDAALQYRDMYGYEDGPRSTPTLADQRLITFGVDGVLQSRDKTSGKLQWSVDTNRQYGVVQNFFGVGSSPLILDDTVIVMVGGSPPEDSNVAPGQLNRVISNGSAIVAFDLATGKEKWKSGDDLASYSSPRTMLIDDQVAILAFARDHLLALDAKTGRPLWKHRHRADILESVNAIVPVVRGNLIFVSECYDVGSVLLRASRSGAQVVWKDPEGNRRAQAMRTHWSTPVLVGGFLYGCSGRNAPDSDFRCIEFETGKVQWVDDRRRRSSVTRVGDHLIVLEERGLMQIMKVNPKKMEIVAEWELDEVDGKRPAIDYPCWAAPIVVGNRLLVRGDQTVLCLDLVEKE